MKTKEQIVMMKDQLGLKIEALREKAWSTPQGSSEWMVYVREYAKCIAQYNILLDVLN